VARTEVRAYTSIECAPVVGGYFSARPKRDGHRWGGHWPPASAIDWTALGWVVGSGIRYPTTGVVGRDLFVRVLDARPHQRGDVIIGEAVVNHTAVSAGLHQIAIPEEP